MLVPCTKYRHASSRPAGRTRQFAPAPLHFTSVSQVPLPFHFVPSVANRRDRQRQRCAPQIQESRGRDAPHIGQAAITVSTASFRSLRRLRSRNMAGLTDRAEVSLTLRSWTPQPAVSDCPCPPKSGQHSAPFHQRRVRKVAVTQSPSRWRRSPGIEMAARLRPANTSAIRREALPVAEDKAIARATSSGQDGGNSRETGQLLLLPLIFHSIALCSRGLHSQN